MGVYDSEIVDIASLVAYLVIPLLTVYPILILLLNVGAVQSPTRNITQFDLIITTLLLVLVIVIPLILFLPVALIYLIAVLPPHKSPDSPEPSDNQQKEGGIVSKIVGASTGRRLIVIFVFLPLLFLSVFLIASNYHTYDEYSGGEIYCSNQNNMQLGVVRFSSLSEIDKKVFRMTINNSYLVSVRDDLNETREYQLMVTKDRGNDEIIIYEGEEKDRDTAFIPPDGLLNEPKMDITGSKYFSGKVEQNQPIQYQGELYRCHIDEFEGYGGA